MNEGTSSTPQVARQSRILEAKHRIHWVRGQSKLLGGPGKPPLKMWKEQALAGREGEVQTTSPTTNDLLLAHDGKGRAHSVARD